MAQKIGKFLLITTMIGYFVYSNFFAYGSKVTFGPNEEVYYTKGATEDEARKVGKVLQDLEIFNGSKTASLQLQKDGSGYLLRVVTQDKSWDDPEVCDSMAYIGGFASQGLGGAKVKVDLCDDSFKSKKIVEMKDIAEETAPEAEATPAQP